MLPRSAAARDLRELVEAVEAGLDLTAVLALVARCARSELRARSAGAYLLSEDGASLLLAAGSGPEQLEPPARRPGRQQGRTLVPLTSARRLLGCLALERPHRPAGRAAVIAALAAQAIENARLWESAGAAAGTRDLLTGLLSHRGFGERLDQELARARRNGQPLSVALLDVDGLAALNERDGHAAGDRALRSAATCLERGLRVYDAVCRLGGDEFALVLPELDGPGAGGLVGRLLDAVAASAGISLSAGIAAFPAHGATPGELRRLAMGALYWARRGGGARAVVYDPGVVEALSPEERAAQLERDAYTRTVRALEAARGHSAGARAVSDWSGFIAAQLGLAPERVERLRLAAFLHDTTAPGGDEDERARLAARVAATALDAEAAGWLLASRPSGERATQPLEARIIAVAGAFVAAGGHGEGAAAGRALAALWRRAGAELDRRCVRALEAVLVERGEHAA